MIKKIRKYILYAVGIVILLLLIIWLFLQSSFGQSKALPIALKYVSTQLGAEIKAEHINISFFDEIQLEDAVVYDSAGDTLLYIKRIDGNIGFFSFFNKQIKVDHLKLIGTKIDLRETAKGTFNYQHIIDHLQSGEKSDTSKQSNSWNIDLKELVLQEAQLDLSSINGDLQLSIPLLMGKLKEFSIEESILHFSHLKSEGLKFYYDKSNIVQIGEENNKITFPVPPFALIIDHMDIQSKGIAYHTQAPLIATPQFDPNHISLESLELVGSNFSWRNAIHFDLNKLTTLTTDGFEIKDLSASINLSDQATVLENTRLQTSNSQFEFSGQVQYSEFDNLINDFLHAQSTFDIQSTTIDKNDILYFIDDHSLPFLDFKHLNNIDLAGKIKIRNKAIDAYELNFKNGDDLSFIGSLRSADLTNISSSRLSFNIKKLHARQSYLESVFPNFTFPKELNNLGIVKGNVKGFYHGDEVNFDNINIHNSSSTKISGSGRIYALKNESGPEMDFTFDKLQANLNTLFSDKFALPDELSRLEVLRYTGKLQGNLKNIAADGSLLTTHGSLNLDAEIKFSEDYSDAHYGGRIKTEDFDLGIILNDSTYGIINFVGQIKGRGLKLDNLESSVDGKIESIYYDGQIYQNIALDGKYKDKIFEGKVLSNDSNLKLDVDGKLDWSGTDPTLDVALDLKHFDLKELGISDSIMVLGGIFRGKVSGNAIENIIGDGTIKNFSVQTQKGIYYADSLIHLKATAKNEGLKEYSIKSPFLDGEIKGKIEPNSLIRFVKNYIKAYIPLEIGYSENTDDNLETYFEKHEDQNFIFSAETKDINPLLGVFFGEDLTINKAKIGAFFSSEETTFDLKGHIDSLLYKGVLLQRGAFFFDGKKSFINGNINLEDISMDNEILVPLTTINTVLNNKIADFNIILANEEDIERLNLSGDLTRTDEYIITFEDSVYLNGFNWRFSPYNKVIFGDYGLYLQDVKLSKGRQSITIYTDENENGEGMEALFDNFSLSELTAIIDKKNDYFEGKIDGSLMINSLYSKPFITADLGLKNVTIADKKAGDLTLIAAQDLATNSVKTTLRLSGLQNDATLNFTYGIGNQSTLGNLDIGKMEMAIIDPYLTEIFVDSEGHINGKIDIKGDFNNLDLSGNLYTHDIKTTPVFTNSRYAVMDTDISFSDGKIDFGTVELKDKNGNSAQVTGKIFHKNLRNSVVDLKVQTKMFEFLNTTENENQLFHGNVNISGNATIYGPIDDVEIDGNLRAVNSSHLIVSPLTLDEDLLTDDFIIYSGDPRKIPTDSLSLEDSRSKYAFPFDVEIKLIVEEDAEFSLILDPISGDKITCNGNSNLTFKLKKNGVMELYGTYTVSEGVYSFSYGLISREFKIQPSSTVVFSGDPLKGELNVDAIYLANTSVYDLIKLESKLTDAQKSEALRKRDINVVLNLTKSIEKPEIKLNINIDEDEFPPSIADILIPKLNQLREEPDELNNQVFGLLLFNNFILAKNADTDLAKTGTDIAIGSISSLVAQQLNRLADGLIEGFEVNFNVNAYSSDFLSTGQEGVITEFGLGVQKSLFNDRLTLSLGTNINLESSAQDVDLSTIVGDFVIGYKIDEDGNYRGQVYQKSTFDRLSAEGNAAKNGVGFFARKEFGEIKRNKK